MRFNRSERAFFILIVLMVGIGLLLYQARVDIGQLLTLPLEGRTLELVSRLDQLNYVTIWLLAATLACGLFLIYPQIRIDALDRGKLQVITQDLSERSQTLEHAALTDSLTGMQNRR